MPGIREKPKSWNQPAKQGQGNPWGSEDGREGHNIQSFSYNPRQRGKGTPGTENTGEEEGPLALGQKLVSRYRDPGKGQQKGSVPGKLTRSQGLKVREFRGRFEGRTGLRPLDRKK